MSKGIDIPINSLVVKFTDKLWIGNNNVFRGRIQRTLRKGETIPEYYDATEKRYKDVLLNSKVDSTVFFDVQPTEDYEGRFKANVWICFSVNLKKLYPNVSERATEYAHEDALKVINKSSFKVTELVKGMDAFSDYNLVKQTDNMNDFYLFRFNATIVYPQKC